MKKLSLALLILLVSMSSFAAETFSHMTMRTSLAMADTSLCELDLGEGELISKDPVIVSYTYTLTVGDKSESISFDQDRQLFVHSTDESTFEMLVNEDGSNLSGEPKDFMVTFDENGTLIGAMIGDVICK